MSNDVQIIEVLSSAPQRKSTAVFDPEIIGKNLQMLFDNGCLPNIKIATTAICNLNCTYCFQNHDVEVPNGAWNIKNLTAFAKGLALTNAPDKVMDFMGGEPMLKKRMIVEFIKDNLEMLNENRIRIETSTNGILLDEEVINAFELLDQSTIVISVDTLDTNMERGRLLTPDQQIKIVENITKIADLQGPYNTTICMTLEPGNIPFLRDSMEVYYNAGARNLESTPLQVHKNEPVAWKEEELKACADIIKEFHDAHPDTKVSFGTEIMPRKDMNCLLGERMMCVDGSGEISGCFFFNCEKDTFSEYMLANLTDPNADNRNVEAFRKKFAGESFKSEACQTCDYEDLCSMCPAANTMAGMGMFDSLDPNCQKFVKYYLDVFHHTEGWAEERAKRIEAFNNM